ncbi:probable 28S ribosomal protein S25, mitochondrial isoform X2 [Zootermopsis nevadensis]|uniref:probable 28S ribosomal protein S25, mitochondrial isoform X2 n=1 Tax=Zootermopsis nevadensis TaxID=136037 RepID=UPI000B8E27F9|nr:probable 28S ribosomal protein S25, mitochondrial isoform X2 [Zootermopsis nevadensis]
MCEVEYTEVCFVLEQLWDFVFWHLPQIQYKNPSVQVVTLTNMTPSPYITCFFDTGERMLIDIDSKTKEEVHAHLKKVICKSEHILAAELKAMQKKDNPANFGFGCDRQCICEVLGQVPCPGLVPLPNHMRGKYKYPKD